MPLIKGDSTYLTIEETAKFLKVSPGYVRTLVVREKLPAMKGARRRLYILEDDLKRYRLHNPGPGELRPHIVKPRQQKEEDI